MIKLMPEVKTQMELVAYYFVLLFFISASISTLLGISGLSPGYLVSLRSPSVMFLIYLITGALTLRKGWSMNIRFPVVAHWAYWLLAPIAVTTVFILTAMLVWLFPFLELQMRGNPTFKDTNLWDGLSAMLLAPVFEEYLFRGVMFGAFSQRFSQLLSASLTTVAFLALHYPVFFSTPERILLLTFFSISLILLRIHTKSLGPCILTHFLYNLVASKALFGF